ncbi:hypothetical protein Gpo141_00012797 [Globisporangium polare]
MPLVLLDGKADLLRQVLAWLEFRDRQALSSANRYTTRSELRQLVFAQSVLRLPPLQSVVNPSANGSTSKNSKNKRPASAAAVAADEQGAWSAYYAGTFLRRLDPQMVPFIQRVLVPLAMAKRLLGMLQFAPNLHHVSFYNDAMLPPSASLSASALASKPKVKQITVMDVGYVSSLTSLRVLDLSSIKHVHCFDAIEALTSLQSLDLSQTNVDDVDALSDLRSLEVLNLRQTRVVDLAFLESMAKTLRWLDISDTRVQNLSPLAQLQNVEYLNLSRNWVQDVTPLQSLTGLRTLKLCNSGSLGPLELVLNTPHLTACHLHDTMLSDIQFLIEAPELVFVDIRRTHVDDLSPLATLSKLETLLIDDSKFTTEIGSEQRRQETARWASGLRNLKNLQIYQVSADFHEEDHVVYAQPIDGSILMHLPKLETLETPALMDYEALYPSFATLRELQLHSWGSEDLRRLALDPRAANLETLKLALPSGHPIVDLSPLESFEGLENLELVDVLFEDLSTVGSLAHLRKLDLSLKSRFKRQMARKYKHEKDFSFLCALTQLQVLNLDGRVDFRDATHLENLSSLRKLNLHGTKVASLASIAKVVQHQLVSLNVASTLIESVSELGLSESVVLEELWIPERVKCVELQDRERFPTLHALWHRDGFNCLANNHHT